MAMTKPFRKSMAIPFALLLWASPVAPRSSANAAHDPATQLAGMADQLAGDEMKQNHIAGLAVTIVVNERIAVSRAYGMADVENHALVSTATRFRTGSIAKPITAAAAMALYQSGRLDLDAPVQEYCPAFPRKQWTITTRELLGHLAGIRHYREDQSDLYSAKHYTDVRGGFELFAADPLLFQPGTRMLYSTYGYSVVGCVIEGASGEEFREALQKLVLEPAKMSSTRPDDVLEIIAGRSRPYTVNKDHTLRNATFVDTSNKIPGGGLISTSDDLAAFAIALESNALLNSQTTALMWTSQKTSAGEATGYGYGWEVKQQNGVRWVEHTGHQPGTSDILLLLPGRDFAVAIMSNTDDIDVTPMAETLARAYLAAGGR